MKIKELLTLFKQEKIDELFKYLEIEDKDYFSLLDIRKEVIDTCLDCEKDYTQCLAWILRNLDLKINETKYLESNTLYNSSKGQFKSTKSKTIKKKEVKSKKVKSNKEKMTSKKKEVKQKEFKVEILF